VFVVVWTTNLFNFMDGIDGIAGSEAVFVSGAGALLNWCQGGAPGLTAAMLCLAAASLGFSRWNWPPAHIFMGDVGSGYLGFTLAVLGLATNQLGNIPIEAWGILGGFFLVDATITLYEACRARGSMVRGAPNARLPASRSSLERTSTGNPVCVRDQSGVALPMGMARHKKSDLCKVLSSCRFGAGYCPGHVNRRRTQRELTPMDSIVLMRSFSHGDSSFHQAKVRSDGAVTDWSIGLPAGP
jgi:hypothetical protein